MKRNFRNAFWHLARITKTEKFFDLLYHFADAIIHTKKMLWVNVDSVVHYCKNNGETVVEIEPECSRSIYEPPYFELSNGKEYKFISPPIYVASLHEVTVLGETDILLTPENMLCDMVEKDKEHRIKWPWGAIRRVGMRKALLVVNKKTLEVDKAINLCGFSSDNYYHFTVAILSRLQYVNQLPDMDDRPVLVDEGIKIHFQLEEILRVVNPNRKVIYVPRETCVKVQSLVQPSMNTWGSLNLESWDLFRISDDLMAKSGIMNIRLYAGQYISEQTTRRIYISRKNCSVVRLINEDEILPLFEKAGFEVVCTEKLSYLEQIKLFSTAKCVVGVGGAAFTNLIYCHPGTVFGCFSPRQCDPYGWGTLAAYVGCQTLFLNPEIAVTSECIVRDQYRVEKEQCYRYIHELLKMCS